MAESQPTGNTMNRMIGWMARGLLAIAWLALVAAEALPGALGQRPDASLNSALQHLGIVALLIAPWLTIGQLMSSGEVEPGSRDRRLPVLRQRSNWLWVLVLTALAVVALTL